MGERKPHNYYNYTTTEVAEELGISRKYAYNLEIRALQKLRRAFEARGITFEDLRLDEPEPDDCPVEPPEIPERENLYG
jgi:hypothetical protein